MAYERRHIVGIAISTTLNGSISDSDTSIVIADNTGWPSGGASGNFFIRIESEVVRCSSRTGTTLTVASSGRGYDGTSAVSHASGVTVECVFTKTDADEANYAVSKTVGKVTTQGDLLYADAANSLERLAVGTSGQFLKSNGTIPGWATLAAADVPNDTWTYAKIQNVSATDRLLGRDTASAGDIEELTVGGGLEFTGSGGIQRSALTGNVTATAGSGSTTIANNVITNAMMTDDSVDSPEIADGAIDLVHMSANSVDSDQYVDGSIDTAHLGDLQVTGGKIAAETIDLTSKILLTSAGTNHTPTLRQATSTETKTVNYSKYWRVGPFVYWWASMTVSSTGSAGGLIDLTLPVSHVFGGDTTPLGGARLFRALNFDYLGIFVADSGGTRGEISFSTLITVPALASGDVITLTAVYPAV